MMMSRLRELEAENSRLKRCMQRSGLKQKYSKRLLEKSGNTVAPKRVGEKDGDT